MRVFIEILKDFKHYFNFKTTYGRRHSLVLGALLLIGLGTYSFLSRDTTEETATIALPEVEVLSVTELSSEARFDTIGKVEAISEANLQAEAGGRVTSVNVKIGDRVRAGQVLATIENSAQRAALTQAQGSYEAALAASAQSDVGVSEALTAVQSARNTAVSTYNASFNTVNGVIINNIDQFFTNPTGTIPGLRIDGDATVMNRERVAYQQILPSWQSKSNSLSTRADLEAELRYARTQVQRTIDFVDLFIAIFNQDGKVGGYTKEQLLSYSTSFTALRGQLIAQRTAIDSALTGLDSADDATTRAELAAQGGRVSAADAQVKIALGSLQAAQSAYQKTIIRTPIQGVVNAFYLKSGDFTAPGQPAGIIANNNGLQIKTFVSEIDSANLNVGDPVTIEDGAAGVITAKADALDPTNGKVAVVVGVEEDNKLTNGATVKLTFSQITTEVETDRILIPLSALKITADGTFVFTVESNTLKAIPVTQGQLYGNNVEIIEGIAKESRIVTDVRGLKDGQTVTVK